MRFRSSTTHYLLEYLLELKKNIQFLMEKKKNTLFANSCLSVLISFAVVFAGII